MLISFCWRHLSKLNFEQKKKFDAIIKKRQKTQKIRKKPQNNNTKVKMGFGNKTKKINIK